MNFEPIFMSDSDIADYRGESFLGGDLYVNLYNDMGQSIAGYPTRSRDSSIRAVGDFDTLYARVRVIFRCALPQQRQGRD